MEHEQHPPTGPTFDTLKAAEALQQAGFTGVQARAVTQAIVEAQDNLASKADIRELRAEMMGEFKAQRADNKRVLDAFEAHVKVLRAENQRLEETLRADNKRMEETLRAEMASQRAEVKAEFKTLRGEMAELRAEVQGVRSEVQALSKSVSMLEKLIFGVTIPMMVGIFVAVVSFAVDHFFFSG